LELQLQRDRQPVKWRVILDPLAEHGEMHAELRLSVALILVAHASLVLELFNFFLELGNAGGVLGEPLVSLGSRDGCFSLSVNADAPARR
jgi:hypothetical protein